MILGYLTFALRYFSPRIDFWSVDIPERAQIPTRARRPMYRYGFLQLRLILTPYSDFGESVMLATQSPGDLDYKCRENINTWFVGKIKEDTAIKKMKPMLSDLKRDIGSELAGQGIGEFFLVRGQDVTGVHSRRSLIETEQVPEEDILRLARCGVADPVLVAI
jgi:hypothetical protein